MKTIKLVSIMILIGGLFAFMGCEEDDPGDLQIESITATGTDLESGESVTRDLNAAQAPTDVPLDATITITFNKEVNPETVSSTAITLSSTDGEVSLELNTNGSEITASPQSELARGTQYTMELAATLQSNDGGSFESLSRNFQTAGQGTVTPPQADSQVAYFPFNNSTEDVAGNHNVTNNTTVTGYTKDRHGYVNSALDMDGQDDIVEVTNPGDLINPSTTISFWMKTDLTSEMASNGFFVMGATAEYGYFIEIVTGDTGPWFKVATRHEQHPESANDFGSATAWGDAIGGEKEEAEVWDGNLGDVLQNKWVHVVLSYDQATSMKRIYLNGTLAWEMDLAAGSEWKMKEMHIDTAGATNESMDVGIGFAGSTTNESTSWANYQTSVDEGANRSFYGQIDDVRFFSTALTNTEVQTLYNAEKPQEK
jgi:hypothetical protein